MKRNDAAKILSAALDAWTADLAATARLAGARESLRVAMLSPHLTASIAAARRELADAEAASDAAIEAFDAARDGVLEAMGVTDTITRRRRALGVEA